MRIRNSDRLLEAMEEGRVYRREELAAFSKSVDRELKQLVKSERVRKAAAGLYFRPKDSEFGWLPPKQEELVRAFLKTDDFLLTSLNYFNGLGVGLTQLVNEMLVYNRKRVGKFKLGGLVYNFQRPPNFPKPKEVNEEFFFVDLLNNYDDLLEPPEKLWDSLKRKARGLRKDELLRTANRFAKARAGKMLKELIADV